MDAVEFFKTANRLCEKGCAKCPIRKKDICMVRRMARLGDTSVEDIEEMVSKVEQWAKDNPVKTRQSEFLKMFPNAKIYNDVIWLCPKYIGCDYKPEENCNEISCFDCKREFWLAEVTDND